MKPLLFVLNLILFCTTPLANAGSQQQNKTNFSPEKIATFAKNVEKYAASKGARAFIIGRLGQPADQLPKGIQFTHTAIAIYSDISLADGKKAKGYAIYNLYQNADSPDKSSIVMDYPVDFYWGATALKAGIIIPSQDLQAKLINAIVEDRHLALHNPNYSLIANPFNNTYQNCTEHTLNVINSAIYDSTDMKQLKANTKAYFHAHPISTNRFKLALGNLFMKGVSTDDHPRKIETTTFSAIANYLDTYDLLEEATILDGNNNASPLSTSNKRAKKV